MDLITGLRLPAKGDKMNIDDFITDKLDNPEYAEHIRVIARMTRVKYDELIKQGFNKDQALELCKNLLSMNT